MPGEADKFSGMDDRAIAYYIFHAMQRSHDWLKAKEKQRDDNVTHFDTVVDGGVLHLDDDRGDVQWKGIKNWTYEDTCPNLNIPFKERFETEDQFLEYQQHEMKDVDDKIKSEKDHKDNYADIDEIKTRIDNGRIILCATVADVNKTAKKGDMKIKHRMGKKLILAVMRK